MGSNSSNQTNNVNHVNADWDLAKKNATKIYNYRIQHYNYIEHGPRDYYMLQVEAEYELGCIPEYFRSGTGTSTQW